MKILPIFLLVCLSFASASSDENNKVSSRDNPKPSKVEVKKTNTNVKEEKASESNHSKTKVDSPKPTIAISSNKVAKTDVPAPENVKVFPWQNLSANVTLQQKFNQTFLNESIVPFLNQCNTFVGKELTQDLFLCPVYFDYLLRLNKIQTDLETTDFKSSELTTFISNARQNSSFCENIFEKNLMKTSKYFDYPKKLEEELSDGVMKYCYFRCYKDGENGQKVFMNQCAVIAFMGSKIKKTDSGRIVDEKDEDKLQYPNEKKTSSDDVDYDSLPNKDEEDDEEQNLPVVKTETKVDLVERKKLPEPVPDTPEIVNEKSVSNPLPIGIEEPDSSSVRYFAYATLIVCVVYFGWHYRSKIMGLIVEGRRSQRGRGGSGRGRKHTAAYRKLDSNLEEAINSSTSSRTNSQIIY